MKALSDERGYFLETWSRAHFRALRTDVEFVQDNASFSRYGVLRGLHFQNLTPQGKLVSVLQGTVLDVAVDLRADSAGFGTWAGVELSEENGRQFYVPEGFAHGFLVLSDGALVAYKCTAPYTPAHERTVRWDDPALGIEWPIAAPILSPKDRRAPTLDRIPAEHLFHAGDLGTAPCHPAPGVSLHPSKT